MHTALIWFNHNVIGNLIANALWGIPSVAVAYIKLRRHQAHHHDQVHNHITQEFAKLAEVSNK